MSVRQKGEKNSQSLEHKRLWWDEIFSKWNYCKCKRLGCTSDASSSKKHVRPTIITWVPHAVLTLYSFRFFLSFLIFILTTYENDNHTHHVPVSIQKNDICGYTWWHSKHKLCKKQKKKSKEKKLHISALLYFPNPEKNLRFHLDLWTMGLFWERLISIK